MAEASKDISTLEDSEVRSIISTGEEKDDNDNDETEDEGSNVRDVLEKLSDFLTKNNLEKQITDERKKITRKIEQKNEEISQKNETHRHKLCDIHEAYKIEIQKENERHVEDLKITETSIRQLKIKLDELQQLNYSISRKIPCTDMTATSTSRQDQTRVRDLLECPVCLEEMKPPKKIFQCSNGHVICELCKGNPEVRSCPTCRVKFRGHNVVRNIVAEKLARSTFETDDMSDLSPPPPGNRASTIESNPPLSFRSADTEPYQLVGFEPAYGYRREQYGSVQHRAEEDEEGDDEDDNDFLEWARILGQTESSEAASSNQHRRLGEAPAGRDELHPDAGGQSSRETPTRSDREYTGPGREPRLREAQLIRTYRPQHPRYLPHHMRRQRTTSQEDPELREIYNEEDAAGERLFFSRTPRTVRRSDDNDNLRGYRRVLSEVKRRLSLQHAVRNFKSKLGNTRSSSTNRTSDGYLYFPDSEVVGYPVAVDSVQPRRARRHTHHPSQFPSKAELPSTQGEAKVKTEEEGEDTLNPIEEANMRRMFYSRREKDSKPSFSDMQGDDPGRRPSITVYQSVDDDHPDLQSIQSIVANMNFSAD